MDKKLNVSATLSLPPDFVTQRDAILAVSGAGKSNAARVMAEEAFALKLPFVAFDPKGDWWGLRAGKEGSAKGGLDVVIFGGAHGDVPLERSSGAFVADLISKERLSSILDLSGFESESAKKVFLHDFGQRLYRVNQDPLKLFLDEADDYIPQQPMKDELRLLRVFENIVRRGRSKGLGVTLVTQRSASLNKNVLTQCETVFAMRTTGPQDVKAIEAWMQYQGGDRQMLSTLAGLDNGEAWVWSPFYLKKMERFRFRLSHTFDSGATPTNHRTGSRRKVATLADVDVASITAKMQETVARAQEEDPKTLRARVMELEKELRKKGSKQPAADSSREESKQQTAHSSGARAPSPEPEADPTLPLREWIGRLKAELDFEQERTDAALRRVEELETHLRRVHLGVDQLSKWTASRPPAWVVPRTTAAALSEQARLKTPGLSANGRMNGSGKQGSWEAGKLGSPEARREADSKQPTAPETQAASRKPMSADLAVANGASREEDLLGKGGRRIVASLYWKGPMSQVRLAILSGYKHTSKGFINLVSKLRVGKILENVERGVLTLTEAGKELGKSLPPPPTGIELVQLWAAELSLAARGAFEVVRRDTGKLSLEYVAAAAGYSSTSKGFINALSELRTLGLIVGGSREGIEQGEAREDFS